MKYKKILYLVYIVSLTFIPINVFARRGCCSHHGGVAGCSSSGRQICNDGTLSPSCTCTPTYIYGCTDSRAKNYNKNANKDNGKCVYYKYGCTDINSINYDSTAEKDDNSCIPIIYGCTDSRAKNYNKNANKDNGKCIYYKYGCTDINSINYDSTAEKDDNSCQYIKNVIDDTNKSEQDIVIDDKTVSDNENNRVVNSILELGTIGTIIYFIKRKK